MKIFQQRGNPIGVVSNKTVYPHFNQLPVIALNAAEPWIDADTSPVQSPNQFRRYTIS